MSTNNVIRAVLPYANVKFLFNLLQTIILVTVLCYLIRKYLVPRTLSAADKLPGLKLKVYHIFGHLSLYVFFRFRKLPLPIHVYDFTLVTGYNYLFSKIGISILWQLHLPLVQIFKADFVEILLNHSTELKKAWFYDFLHPWLGTGLLTSHDEKWKHRRKLLTPAFHFNILKDFLPIFNKQSKVLVEILKKHTSHEFVNIVPSITFCSLDIICESILGKELHSQTQPSSPYVQAVGALTKSVFERLFSPWLWSKSFFPYLPFGRRFEKNRKIIQDITNQMIAEKKKAKHERKAADKSDTEITDDVEYIRKKRALLDLLLDEHIDNNSITEDEIREEVNTFTFEGHDTTSMGMCWALYLIGLHPWVQERVHNELDSIFGEDDRDASDEDLKNMKYLECVIKETLRLYPSVPVFGREIREYLKFNEHVVPKGSTCMVYTYLLHRDPDVFPNPEKFDPDRFMSENMAGRHPFAYVPFSAGPRNCIGQRFAVMEEKTVLSAVLRKYKVRSLDPRDKVHIMDELVLRPYNGLRLQIRERNQHFDFKSVYYRP